jgi:hypothetical protein
MRVQDSEIEASTYWRARNALIDVFCDFRHGAMATIECSLEQPNAVHVILKSIREEIESHLPLLAECPNGY